MGLFGNHGAGTDKFAGGIPPASDNVTPKAPAVEEIPGMPGMPGATFFGEMDAFHPSEPEEVPATPPPADDAVGRGVISPEDTQSSPFDPPQDTSVHTSEEQLFDGSRYESQPLGPHTPEVHDKGSSRTEDNEFRMGSGPCFTKVQPEDANYAGKFSLDMPHVDYIGSTEILLGTLRDLEQKYKVSMPIRSCGLDPVVFEHANKGEEDAPDNRFVIMDGDNAVRYELVTVDGAMYASCMTAPLDTEHLQSVIREATMAMTEQGYYIFYMVGLCVLASEGSDSNSLMRTLRLNSYELSVLCEYMESFGTDVEYGTCNGRQCIYFKAKS